MCQQSLVRSLEEADFQAARARVRDKNMHRYLTWNANLITEVAVLTHLMLCEEGSTKVEPQLLDFSPTPLGLWSNGRHATVVLHSSLSFLKAS